MNTHFYKEIFIQKYGKETLKDLQNNLLVYLNEYMSGCLDGTYKTPEYDLEDEIENANNAFQENLGYVPDIFSYPYGEYNLQIKDFIKEKKFKAAFGQQSGIAFNEIDIFELPRFSLNEEYGSIERFKFAANSKPLAIKEITPRDLVIKDVNPPLLGFTLINDIKSKITCYPSHKLTTTMTRLGEKRFEVRFNNEFPKGRTRVNCTTNDNNEWRWFGIQFFRP